MATKANLVIDQGADFSSSLSLTDPDGNKITLQDYTGRCQIRKSYTSLTATDVTVTLDDATSSVTLSLSASATSNLAAGRYVYDVELTNSANNVVRIVEGIVTVTPQVTR